MTLTIKEQPQYPVIIVGFPGVGVVGSIVTEFLVQLPGTREIGSIFFEEMQPIVIIHEGVFMQPAGVYYNQQYNIIIIHTLSQLQGLEWRFSKTLCEMYKQLNAREIVCIEGVASQDEHANVYAYSMGTKESLEKANMTIVSDAVLLGPSAALTLQARQDNMKLSALFASSKSQLPDSVAAAKIIRSLDAIYGFNIDPNPLETTAEAMEEKVKLLLQRSSEASEEKQSISYFG